MSIIVNIYELTNHKTCIDPNLAEIVFENISGYLKDDNYVEVSFKGLDMIICTFLNTAIGKLYNPKLFDNEFVDSHVSYIDTDESIDEKIQFVIENAKKFYSERMK